MLSIKVACLGDSITQGTDSYNWVADLQQKLSVDYEFYNYGVNGELAYNNLKRIDKLVTLEPNFIVILVGTNDVLATLSEANTRLYKRNAALPRMPDMAWYVDNLEQIIVKLLQQTNASIALTSLPVIGEDLMDTANKAVGNYNQEVKRIVRKYALHYLPLNEAITGYLEANPVAKPVAYRPYGWRLKVNMHFRTKVLKQDWESYAGLNGLQVTTDTIHLNQVSGKMMVDLVAQFLKSKS
ncbi:SGNH/GDSL hydrolase family protein [uncultured Mucilaginibacter sp.]|uniref:SGNH/GDSL hydrolase family protein n=1 Tax=uncultured Mucilaginibacter sp. TaxID=797541 RepID=UPI0025DE9849|nr:SGNH/GDSL hydrolase family protein [uncultured Mucilaginibacter sp.]